MFTNILIPVDLTDRHQQALDIAARLAKESAGEVTRSMSSRSFRDSGRKRRVSSTDASSRRPATIWQNSLAKLGRYLEERHVPRREEVIFGDRAHEIVRYATARGIDLIVLSSHRIDLQNPSAGWGTISYKVGILSQCPVLLVK
jgi:nucleotide-binding universal stress UspA family protein